MSKKILPIFLMIPPLTVINQGCMKLLAEQTGDTAQALTVALQSPYLYGILASEILSFILWLKVLSIMSVARAVPITAVAYILVLLMGWIGFDEPFHWVQLLGSAFILVGVGLLATPISSQKGSAA